jgi:hypothetical protein
MTLGAGGLVRPLVLREAALLHGPLIAMSGALVLVVLLTWRGLLTRNAGFLLVGAYSFFVVAVLSGRF